MCGADMEVQQQWAKVVCVDLQTRRCEEYLIFRVGERADEAGLIRLQISFGERTVRAYSRSPWRAHCSVKMEPKILTYCVYAAFLSSILPRTASLQKNLELALSRLDCL